MAVNRRAESGNMDKMKTLQVVGQTDQIPFASGGNEAAQRKLAEAHHLLNDTKDRLNRTLAEFVDRLADLGAQLIEHLRFVISILGWWFRFTGQKRWQIQCVAVSPSGNVGFNAHGFKGGNGLWPKVPVIHRRRRGSAQFSRDGLSGNRAFSLVIGVIRKCIANNQATFMLDRGLSIVRLFEALVVAILQYLTGL